jgi:hypothetical protein
MNTQAPLSPLLTAAEVGDLLRTSAAGVRDLVAEGRLKTAKAG